MCKPGLNQIVVRGTVLARADRRSNHQRQRGSQHEANLRRLIDDLVHGAKREIYEVNVRNRAHSAECSAHTSRDDRALRYWSIPDAFGAELCAKPGYLSKMTAEREHVGADIKDRGIPDHFVAQRIPIGPRVRYGSCHS